MTMDLITGEQFDALASLLRLRDGSKSKRATRKVCVEGKSVREVAKELDMPYADVARAVKAAKRGLSIIASFNETSGALSTSESTNEDPD